MDDSAQFLVPLVKIDTSSVSFNRINPESHRNNYILAYLYIDEQDRSIKILSDELKKCKNHCRNLELQFSEAIRHRDESRIAEARSNVESNVANKRADEAINLRQQGAVREATALAAASLANKLAVEAIQRSNELLAANTLAEHKAATAINREKQSAVREAAALGAASLANNRADEAIQQRDEATTEAAILSSRCSVAMKQTAEAIQRLDKATTASNATVSCHNITLDTGIFDTLIIE